MTALNVRLIARLAVGLLLAAGLAGCPGKKQGDDHDGHGHGAQEEGGHEEHEGEEHEEGVVRVTPEQVQSAAIEVRPAGPGKVATVLQLTAVVNPNQDAQVHVTPKVPGVVRAIHKQLGDVVRPGDVMCEIESVELGEAVSDYLKDRTLLAAQRDILTQETALLERSVQLATMIFERERELKERQISTLRAYYEAEKAMAEAQLGRDRRLLELRAEVQQLEVELTAARERLRIYGLTAEDIERLSAEEGPGIGHYAVRAAGPGVIVARHITLNEFVEPAATLYEIHDLSRVWVDAKVYEKDLAQVRTGQAAHVRLQAFHDVELEGRVTRIGTSLDRATRAVDVRIELDNQGIEAWPEAFPIRPGMFATVDLVVGEREAAITLPEVAVVHEGDEHFVFVRVDPSTFRRQAVTVLEGAGGIVEIVQGLEAGAEVAVAGTFTLKSMARAEELGGGHSH